MNLQAYIHVCVNVFIWKKNIQQCTHIYLILEFFNYRVAYTDFIFFSQHPQKSCTLFQITYRSKETKGITLRLPDHSGVRNLPAMQRFQGSAWSEDPQRKV